MAKMHQGLQRLLEFFDEYKGEDGVLDKNEFKAIFQKEIKGNIDQSIVDKVFDKMDENKDRKLDMEEYTNVVCLMMRALYYSKMHGGFAGGRCSGGGSCK